MSERNRYENSSMEKNTLKTLREEVVIPEIVQRKANAAFALIQNDAKRETGEYSTEEKEDKMIKMPKMTGYKKKKRKFAIAALAAALTVGGVSAGAAAYINWSSSMKTQLQVTESQKQMAEDTGLVDFPEISVTDNDVTVTAQQSIVDNYYAYLSFKVEGYEIGEKEEPTFDDILVTVDGEDVSWGASFYDSIVRGSDGRPVFADGSEIPESEDGSFWGDYTMEDGSMEFQINLSGNGEKGWLLGKDIHVELQDLCIYTDKGGSTESVADGRWVFDWTLNGADTIYTAECEEALGDTGAVVTGAEISPISIKVLIDMPRQEYTENGYRESQVEIDGEMQQVSEPFEFTSYVEPPQLTGVKLKDGTLLMNLYMGPGYSGYVNEDSDQYENRFAIDRILDVDQVQSLLFIKEYPEGENVLTEDNLYVVDIR